MKVLVSGSSGLVGSALIEFLIKRGDPVWRLVRSQGSEDREISWDPAHGKIDAPNMEGLDGVVHLAGENIAAARWTAEQKAKIRDSRVKGTRLLSEALAGLKQPPKTLVAASAIGFYGDRGDELLTEESHPGSDFLAEVCQEWEAAASPATQKGIRVVHLRFGLILAAHGGALAKMLPPFRLGGGGKIADGRQYMSWITLDDVIGVIDHALTTEIKGAVNTVSPNPVTNLEFTKKLGSVLSRPTVLPVPAFAARLAFGEMADALLLASTRVKPARLAASGYNFKHPLLEPALRHVLGQQAQAAKR